MSDLNIPDPDAYRQLSNHFKSWVDQSQDHMQQLDAGHSNLIAAWQGDGADAYGQMHAQVKQVSDKHQQHKQQASTTLDNTAGHLDDAKTKRDLAISLGVGGGLLILGAIFSFGLAAGGAAAAEGGAAAAEVAAETAVDDAVTTFGDGFTALGEDAGEGVSTLPDVVPPDIPPDVPPEVPPEGNVPPDVTPPEPEPDVPPETPPEGNTPPEVTPPEPQPDVPPETPPEGNTPPEVTTPEPQPDVPPDEEDPFGGMEVDEPTYEPGEGATGTYEERLEALSRDPAHGGEATPGSVREAEVGLDLEAEGKLPGPISREASGYAEFVDGKGQAWDVKAFNSEYGFDLDQAIYKVGREIGGNKNVIIDSANMSSADIEALQQAIDANGWAGNVIWFP